MGGPPGSQAAQKKPNRSRRKKQKGASKDGAGNNEAGSLASCNGCDVAVAEARGLPSSFQPPRQPNVHVVCAPLRQLYDQVRLNNCGSQGSSGGKDGGCRNRKLERKGRPFTLQQLFSQLPYPRGIMNNSNFCFMNSILQALIFIPSFAQLAVSVSCDAEARQLCSTLATLGKWVLQYWKPGFTRLVMIAPKLMPHTPAGANRSNGGTARSPPVPASQRILDGSVQEDAQEFLQKLLERVHEELVGLEEAFHQTERSEAATEMETRSNAPAAASSTVSGEVQRDTLDDGSASSFHTKGWTFVKGKEKLVVREHEDAQGHSKLLASIFGGTLESHLQGNQRHRNHVSVLVEKYYCLPIDVGFAPECTIEEALEHTFMTERIYDSAHEKNLKKTLRLGQLPSILFLQLRRWAVTREGELVKLDNVVRIKPTLMIPRTICRDETLCNTERAYRLLSVVCHRGDDVSWGHYVTYLAHHVATPAVLKVQPGEPADKHTTIVRSPPEPSTVILCDDANVSVRPAKNMEKETIYFLVYQKTS
ncbi:ubiquitin hydrolase, putative [Leishmania tarentolae]|uniref:ubiquitinyl hydrolase 1 n=1 Tax=Leishmania tarentolae TaxID=5689 RepID=A0A640KVC0_LEITA|nr:ubiquitin hydrolase, putative [Leishmania tarentolae]